MRAAAHPSWLVVVLLAAACGETPTSDDLGTQMPDLGAAVADQGPPGPPLPALLSEVGLYADAVGGAVVDDALGYGVRYPLWTDSAAKRRFLLLPEGGSIDTSDADGWAFPVGTRVFKEFLVDGRLVETRLLWKFGPNPSDWTFVSYRLRDDGTEGDPVPAGEANVLGTQHDVPSQEDCRNCHQGGSDFVLGIGALQLDRLTFDDWVDWGVLPTESAWEEPPGDDGTRAVLGYFHGNCGHCHNEVHPLGRNRTLRLNVPVGTATPERAPAWLSTVGVMAAHEVAGASTIVAPGDPQGSQLFLRMELRDRFSMPPLGTEVADDDALAGVESWILALTP